VHPVARGILSVAIVLPIAALSIHPVCDLYFDCGCAPLWAGAAEHCDIQTAGPPDCPWCVGDRFTGVAALLLLGALAGIALGLRLSRGIAPPVLFGFAGYTLLSWIASL
jgi:hypothetical protein